MPPPLYFTRLCWLFVLNYLQKRIDYSTHWAVMEASNQVAVSLPRKFGIQSTIHGQNGVKTTFPLLAKQHTRYLAQGNLHQATVAIVHAVGNDSTILFTVQSQARHKMYAWTLDKTGVAHFQMTPRGRTGRRMRVVFGGERQAKVSTLCHECVGRLRIPRVPGGYVVIGFQRQRILLLPLLRGCLGMLNANPQYTICVVWMYQG